MITKNTKYIKELILRTIGSVGMELDVKLEQSGINMSYNFILHYISFDAMRIKTAVKELQQEITIEDYIKTFSLHELGHAIDRDALLASLDKTVEIYDLKSKYSMEELYNEHQLLSAIIEEHQMNIIFEKTAWNHAELLNRKYRIVDETIFHLLKERGLKTYIDSYQKDFNIYINLLSLQNEQIA